MSPLWIARTDASSDTNASLHEAALAVAQTFTVLSDGKLERFEIYDLDVTTSDRPVRIAERFCVVDGLITEIEALFHASSAPERES